MYLPYVGKKITKLLALKEDMDFEMYWDGACSAERILEFAPKGMKGLCWEQRCCLERTDLTVKFCGISGICGYEHSIDFIRRGRQQARRGYAKAVY